MMLRHLGEEDAAKTLPSRLSQRFLRTRRCATPDIGGKSTTTDMGEAIERESPGSAQTNA